MKEEPFKFHKELRRVYRDIPDERPDGFFSSRVMAEVSIQEQGLVQVADRFLAPAFITLGACFASCLYLVCLMSNMLDSMEIFSAMGLLDGNFGL